MFTLCSGFCNTGGIDMEETKNLCIYIGKDETQAHFKNQEHIIPACIGGMQRLPKGYVSDEVNTLFSALELKLARNSPITLPRMFVGPGKRGSHNPKRRGGASKIVSVMKSNENGMYSLGYIRMGTPITIDQIHITQMENGKHQVSFCFDTEEVDKEHYLEMVTEWMPEVKSFDGQTCVIIREEGLAENEIILGQAGNRWYLAARPEMDEEKLKSETAKEIRLLALACEQEMLNQSATSEEEKIPSGIDGFGNLCVEKSQVTSNMHQMIDMNAYKRVVAKIAFNCLAEVRGRDYVMQPKFDFIREAILTGEEINHVVFFQERDKKHTEVLDSLGNAKGFGVWRHTVIIAWTGDRLEAEVMLYGNSSPMLVILAQENCRDFGIMDGYVCDWENHREMRFMDYIEKTVVDE